jgi:hypothetical protein
MRTKPVNLRENRKHERALPHLAIASRAAAALAVLLTPALCAAQSTIRRPGDRTQYRFEAEPHLLAGVIDPPGWAGGDGFGLGFRGTVEVARNAFVPKINNSVGIGFGADWVHYPYGDYRGRCTAWTSDPAGTRVCTEVDGAHNREYLYLPVVLQWNFWLSRQWSVFAEPGFSPYFHGGHLDFDPFVFYAGGRFQFADRVTLTMRIGYPTFSFGVSFLL